MNGLISTAERRSDTMKIAGLDIGTTGCKCTVFSPEGLALCRAYRDYPAVRGEGGHEIDAAAVMTQVYAVLAEAAAQHPDIAGVGVTSFGESFVLAGADGAPLRPTLLYTDPRGAAECQALSQQLGDRRIAAVTGLRPHEMYSLPKIMWVMRHEPQVWRAVKTIHLIQDYAVFCLTGKRQIDYSLAARTMALDIQRLDWSEELLSAAGVPREMLPRPVAPGTAAGPLLPDMARRLGLRPDTLVISAGHDQLTAAVGAGAFSPGVAVDGAGTVECLTPIFQGLPDMEKMFQGHFAVVPYVRPGQYVAYAFSYTGGALIQWCVEKLAGKEAEEARRENISVNEYLERRSQSPTGLLVLPHFAGAATPYMDTGSRGAILGLTTATAAADIYRGCMEGVAYEMLLNARALQGAGARFTRLRATGGGARSREWMQMKADMLNLPVTALKTADAGTVGCAMLTGVAVGLFKDLEEAAARLVEERETFLPRPEMHEKYGALYQKYARVYQAVRPLTGPLPGKETL